MQPQAGRVPGAIGKFFFSALIRKSQGEGVNY